MSKEITPSRLWEWLSKVNTVKFLLSAALAMIFAGAMTLSMVWFITRR
jgi:hypothetical protein